LNAIMGDDSTVEMKDATIPHPTQVDQQRIVLQQRVVIPSTHAETSTHTDEKGSDDDDCRHLHFALFACQHTAPYGPARHTASLFLKIISRALTAAGVATINSTSTTTTCVWNVRVVVYDAVQSDYPQTEEEWDSYDGFLLPGSLSAAYDTEEWILKLANIITSELHGKNRKSLGICFGHQLYAHAFSPHGLAIKCPSGFQAGRKTASLTPEGSFLLGSHSSGNNGTTTTGKTKEELDALLYTHGDMVEKLPPCAVCLGGTEPTVPIQTVAYFQTEQDAAQFQAFVRTSDRRMVPPKPPILPIAITFQAHPEYADRKHGAEATFGAVMDKVNKKDMLSLDELKAAEQDMMDNFHKIEDQSTQVVARVGAWLGWWESNS